MEKCREKVETAAQQTELLSEEAVEQMSNQELLFLYRESGDEELKWKLVLRMTGMVRAIAAQVWGIYSSFAQLDDIVEEGILVLLSAVDKFDPSKDVKFETYVSKRLRGMIESLPQLLAFPNPRSVLKNRGSAVGLVPSRRQSVRYIRRLLPG